jgi:hypothetical protein
VYVTHDEKCYMCKKPIDLQTMEVDHVIPESLGKDPARLAEVKRLLGRPEDFDLNSHENWLPACRPCNGRKLETVFDPSLLVQLNLQRAAERANKARAFEAKSLKDKEITKALNIVQRAFEAGSLSANDLQGLRLLASVQESERAPDMRGQPVRLSPLLELVLESNGVRLVRGPYGIGAALSAERVHPNYICNNCGVPGAWNGARCVACGELSDD